MGRFPNQVVLSASQYESEIGIPGAQVGVLKENRLVGGMLLPLSV